MLEGITILNEWVAGGFNVGMLWLVVIIGVLTLVLFAVGVGLLCETDEFGAILIAFGLIFGFITVLMSTKIDPIEVTHYQVTISEEVSMAEFYEQYEVIDQEGLIYTITEREE